MSRSLAGSLLSICLIVAAVPAAPPPGFGAESWRPLEA